MTALTAAGRSQSPALRTQPLVCLAWWRVG